MTWTVHIDGHDDLEAEAKAAFENGLVTKVLELVTDIRSGEGITISRADVTTNTTGPVDALGATDGSAGSDDEVEAHPPDDAEAEPGEVADDTDDPDHVEHH